jgi:3-oxoacid CoA-transferase subunit B
VDLVITDRCVFACGKISGQLSVLELAPGVSIEEVIATTGTTLAW